MANDNKLVNLADLKEAFDNLKVNASQSAAGLMSATDKTKLDGIAAGAQVNSITGVKGDGESSYRTGNVNLTPANIGAVDKSGDTMSGDLVVEHSGDTSVIAKCKIGSIITPLSVYLNANPGGKHGLWSNGYYDGADVVTGQTAQEYIIYRDKGGKVHVADHYAKDEIDSKFAATNVFSLFTVNSTNCDLRFAKRTGNVVMLSLYVKTGVVNASSLVTEIDSSILPARLDYAIPLYANDGKLVASGSAWIEYDKLSRISYYGSTTTVGGTATITYIIG